MLTIVDMISATQRDREATEKNRCPVPLPTIPGLDISSSGQHVIRAESCYVIRRARVSDDRALVSQCVVSVGGATISS